MIETPFRKAWLAFLASEEGKSCITPDGLGMSQNVRRTVLENRLHAAFCSGWNQGQDATVQAFATMETRRT
jgi:hypothetical protein